MEEWPLEILYMIFRRLSDEDGIIFASLCRRFRYQLKVSILPPILEDRMSNAVLGAPMFSELKILHITDPRVYRIDHLRKLNSLSVSSGMNRKINERLNELTELKVLLIFNKRSPSRAVRFTQKILSLIDHQKLNIANLTNLTVLCMHNVDIAEDTLKMLTKLDTLMVPYNDHGLKIGHLTRLTKLHINDCGKIKNKELFNLTKLTELNISNNVQISDISVLTNLVVLDASGRSALTKHGLYNLTNLTNLNLDSLCENDQRYLPICDLDNLTRLTKLNIGGFYNQISPASFMFMTQLTYLTMRYNYRISIMACPALEKLNISYSMVGWFNAALYQTLTSLNISNNITVNTVANFSNLTKLCISGCQSLITQADLDRACSKLTVLNISENKQIYDVNRFIHLTKLYACNCPGLLTASINALVNLERLSLADTPGVTDISFATKLKKLDIRRDCGVGPTPNNIAVIIKLNEFYLQGNRLWLLGRQNQSG